eukprot:Unigene1683_Nuclearia_a/m.5184 Unigene1683_Nuclearia_a/g.5184  ORF Unigene1683_Nuclearia_a/g.5184 Unigene1683_Nuclearia_a/m.5184 type:complete len:306 (+) Unigene1683_Nuclearia_a:122-1039(+)
MLSGAAGALNDEGDSSLEVTLIIFAVLATVVGWLVTVINISQHVNHWNAPEHQMIIVQMLVLVIIWSTFSMLVVIQPIIKPLTQVMMDSYEAYLIVLFMQLMTTYLGGYEQVVEDIGEMKDKYRLGPFYLTPSLRGYTIMRLLVYQFIIIKPGLSIVRCVLYYMDYKERLDLLIDVDQVFVIFRYTMLTSLILAMLGLLMFYRMFYSKLKPYKVGIKFLAMKLFIFLYIMQSFLFTFLEDESGGKEAYFTAARIEYFCVCIEMALASFLNMNVIFTFREWVNEVRLWPARARSRSDSRARARAHT